MSPRELSKQFFDTNQRVERSTEFLVRLIDMLQGRIDPFEEKLLKLIADEYIDCLKDLVKRGKNG